MAQIRIGQFEVPIAGVDANAQVDVALTYLNQIDARAQLAYE